MLSKKVPLSIDELCVSCAVTLIKNLVLICSIFLWFFFFPCLYLFDFELLSRGKMAALLDGELGN